MKPQKELKKRTDRSTIAGFDRTIVVLIVLCLAIFGLAKVAAKYVKETETTNVAVAKEFYFKSDLLDGNTHTISPLDENGTASLTFQLMNHEDELRYSDVDIKYEVTVNEIESQSTNLIQNDVTDQVVKDSNNAKKGTIPSGQAVDDNTSHDQTVTLQGLEAGKSYKVTAKAISPYEKELTATIKVNPIDTDVKASISDEGSYVEATVWTVDYNGNITLKYCDGLIPDNTDPMLEDARLAGKSVDFAQVQFSDWKANTSHVFRFFKADTAKSYSVIIDNATKVVTVSEGQ